MEDKITLVITSCNRFELLKRTVYSFLTHNTYPIEKYIIIDDSVMVFMHKQLEHEFGAMFEIILNTQRIGQTASIDKAYARVKTPYIFHCEDDWEFYRPSFIEKSLAILKHDAQVLQVWLREHNDTNGHPIESYEHEVFGIHYQKLALNYSGYHGFSLNPGLRRLSDYNLIKPFTKVLYNPSEPGKAARFYCPEMEISELYRQKGFRAVILENGYVKHIGAQHRVGWD